MVISRGMPAEAEHSEAQVGGSNQLQIKIYDLRIKNEDLRFTQPSFRRMIGIFLGNASKVAVYLAFLNNFCGNANDPSISQLDPSEFP